MTAKSPTADSIFCVALDIESSKNRDQYVEKACGDDAEMRHRVMQLLKAHFSSGSFMEWADQPVNETQEMTEERDILVSKSIGPYKLLQVIGEGGMGTVYMAKQTEPVNRKVALKLIKTGMDTRQVIARFEAERQALAMMDHPNIAKVLDAGATESGRPYFVMELVKGQPITQFCDDQQMDTESRLKLFQKVCHAVQHAHQKGIIHRDLKPSNVMVAMYDDQPVPKVIDFGVAKATGDELTDKTMFTRFGQIVGTLEYMSPEQAQFNNVDIDTRSDIYSLGAILYELLAGEPPFDREKIKSQALDETLRMIREDEPTRPSTKFNSASHSTPTAASRRTTSAKLEKLLRGELDWIAIKALEKDRSRRYETAGAFAEDIERMMDNLPITARPPSKAYRFKKYVLRNRGVVSTLCLISLLITAFAATSYFQASQLKTSLEYQQSLSNFLLNGIFRAASPSTGDVKITVKDALIQSRELLKSYEHDPQMHAWLESQIGRYFFETGAKQEAEQVLNSAYGWFAEYKGPDDEQTIECQYDLARAQIDLQRKAEAIENMKQVLNWRRKHDGANSKSVADALNRLGSYYSFAGKPDDARKFLFEAKTIALKNNLAIELSDNTQSFAYLAETAENWEESRRKYQESLELVEAIGPGNYYPDQPGKYSIQCLKLKARIAQANTELGLVGDAIRSLENVLIEQRDLLDEFHPQVGHTLQFLGIAQWKNDQPGQALVTVDKIFECLREYGEPFETAVYRTAFNLKEVVMKDLALDKEAVEFHRKLLPKAIEATGPASSWVMHIRLRICMNLKRQGQLNQAQQAYQSLIDTLEETILELDADSRSLTFYNEVLVICRANLAKITLLQGKTESALTEFNHVEEFLTANSIPGHKLKLEILKLNQGLAYRRLGRFAESKKSLGHALNSKDDTVNQIAAVELSIVNAIDGNLEEELEKWEATISSSDPSPGLILEALQFYSVCAEQFTDKEQSLVRKVTGTDCHGRAIQLLQQPRDAEFFDSLSLRQLTTRLQDLKQDRDYQSIRDTEEFQRIIGEATTQLEETRLKFIPKKYLLNKTGG